MKPVLGIQTTDSILDVVRLLTLGEVDVAGLLSPNVTGAPGNQHHAPWRSAKGPVGLSLSGIVLREPVLLGTLPLGEGEG